MINQFSFKSLFCSLLLPHKCLCWSILILEWVTLSCSRLRPVANVFNTFSGIPEKWNPGSGTSTGGTPRHETPKYSGETRDPWGGTQDPGPLIFYTFLHLFYTSLVTKLCINLFIRLTKQIISWRIYRNSHYDVLQISKNYKQLLNL